MVTLLVMNQIAMVKVEDLVASPGETGAAGGGISGMPPAASLTLGASMLRILLFRLRTRTPS